MNSSEFTKRLKQGSILYAVTLENYIQEDELLLNEVKPDLVVRDFRLDWLFSARKAKIPWTNLANAYLSTGAKPKFIVPELSLVNFFGEKPSNLDQYLNMFFVEKNGVGQDLRAGLLNSTTLKKTVENMFRDQQLKNSALKMRELFSRTDAISNFKQFLENHFK